MGDLESQAQRGDMARVQKRYRREEEVDSIVSLDAYDQDIA